MQRAGLFLAVLSLAGCSDRTRFALAYVAFEVWPLTLCAVLSAAIPAAALADAILRRRVGHKA